MKNLLKILILIYAVNYSLLYSQTDTSGLTADTTDLRNDLQEEILMDGSIDESEESKSLDFLENLKRNPLDLNKLTLDELNDIPFLSSVLAKKIIEYRVSEKIFKSKRALLKVEGITEDLYEKIKVYLVVRQSVKDVLIEETGNKFSVSEVNRTLSFSTKLRSSYISDLQQKDGFLNGNYEGSRAKIYNQLNSKYSKIDYKLEANLTIEKDAGEKNLTDFVSAFLELKDYKFIKNAVAGDYTLNFAQGIAMWTTLGFSKGIDAVSPLKKKGKGIDGYSSVNEVQFFRGAAAKLNFKNFYLNLFYSDNHYDATIDTTDGDILSFYYDGYHRTTSEINRKNSAKEKLLGGRVSYESLSLKLGSTYWTSKFSKSIIPDSLKLLFNFSGTSANMLSVDYDIIFKNMNIYGEWARSQSGSIAGIGSVQMTFFRLADVLLSYRNYPIDFAPVHSFGFGERNGNTYNERGFYAGITLRPLKGLSIDSYFDQFSFPYRTFFDPVPTSGNDFLTSIEWRASKGLIFNLKYKNENKDDTRAVTDDFGRKVKRIDNRNQLNARAGIIYQVTDRFRIRSRFEYVNVDYENFGGDNKGMLFFSDVRIIPLTGLVLDMRYLVFETDDYDSRIYEFENDIKGVLSNVALYGKGR
ncbi:MAG: helix-hairpin-helix domain-containing protein, partial [Ignavibacteria bacterium]